MVIRADLSCKCTIAWMSNVCIGLALDKMDTTTCILLNIYHSHKSVELTGDFCLQVPKYLEGP